MSGQVAQQPTDQEAAVQKSMEFFDQVFDGAAVKPFAVRFWDGSEWQHGKEPPHFTLELKHPASMQKIFWKPTEVSLGEAYIFGDFDVHGDLESSFELGDYLLNRDWQLAEKLRLGLKLLSVPRPSQEKNRKGAAELRGRTHSKKRDAEAVQYHYDVSNDFYRLWLDKYMIYSCALFHSQEDTIDEAQYRKLDYLCRKLRLEPGEKLLDIGCGWGGLVMHACQNYGVDATGITLSQPQADLGNERILEAGLSDRCRVEVLDYRDIPSDLQFDKAVSVGMFEHVGEAKLPDYFAKAYQLLKPGGVFLNHGITESKQNTRNKAGESFIDKYVFPDGELLPISTSLRVAEENGFEIRDVEGLREHYAMTLRQWVRRLEDNLDEAVELTNSVTSRIWRIYMAGSAYSFETGRIGLYQSLLVKSGQKPTGLPLTRCDWYRPCPNGHH